MSKRTRGRPLKVCGSCKHFYFYAGVAGYSEYTPALSAGMQCMKDHWDLLLDEISQEEFRRIMSTAALDCSDFTAAEESAS